MTPAAMFISIQGRGRGRDEDQARCATMIAGYEIFDVCPSCQGPRLTVQGKKQICSNCGAAFNKVGSKHRLVAINDGYKKSRFWRKCRQRLGTVDDWSRIAQIIDDDKQRQALEDYSGQHNGFSPICTIVSVSGWPLIQGSECVLLKEESTFLLRTGENDGYFRIPYSKLTSVDISGPGTQTSDAGIWGGGFGLEGAAKGLLAASVINNLTKTSRTNTFIKLATIDAELFLHTSTCEPEALRMELSPAFNRNE